MSLQQLRFVLAVAETRSLTKAAKLCFVTQPALSNAIHQLEDELGASLFIQTTRSVTPSEPGELLLVEMKNMEGTRLRIYSKASEYLTREDNVIRMGISPLISHEFTPDVLNRIERTNKNLKIGMIEMNLMDMFRISGRMPRIAKSMYVMLIEPPRPAVTS